MEMVKCPKCGKTLQKMGLGGHLFAIHGIRSGPKLEMQQLREISDRATKELEDLKYRIAKATKLLTSHKWGDKEEVDLLNQALVLIRR